MTSAFNFQFALEDLLAELRYARRNDELGRLATSNWASPRLTEAQLVYAANDAYAAFYVHEALASPSP